MAFYRRPGPGYSVYRGDLKQFVIMVWEGGCKCHEERFIFATRRTRSPRVANGKVWFSFRIKWIFISCLQVKNIFRPKGYPSRFNASKIVNHFKGSLCLWASTINRSIFLIAMYYEIHFLLFSIWKRTVLSKCICRWFVGDPTATMGPLRSRDHRYVPKAPSEKEAACWRHE